MVAGGYGEGVREPSRLIQTSAGPLEIELASEPFSGRQVVVKIYDDDGWVRDRRGWSTRYGHNSDRKLPLDAFLSTFAGLPEDEAGDLANAILTVWVPEWRERGGERFSRTVWRGALLLIVGLLILGLLAVLGIVLLVVTLT